MSTCVGGTPHICGGVGGAPGVRHDSCLKYDFEADTWTISGDMQQARSSSAHANDERLGLIMAGGFDSPNAAVNAATSSVIRSFDAINFEELAEIDPGVRQGCMAIKNSTTLYVGGGAYNEELLSYDPAEDSSRWNSEGEMPNSHVNPGCGVAVNLQGQFEFVITGGEQPVQDAVDIYNMETETWKTSGKASSLKSTYTITQCS